MIEQEIKHRRIRKLDPLIRRPFDEKRYEVFKRNEFGSGWCNQGRKLSLRGVHNLLGTEGFSFEWDGEAAYEVGMYCIDVWKKKKLRGEQNV